MRRPTRECDDESFRRLEQCARASGCAQQVKCRLLRELRLQPQRASRQRRCRPGALGARRGAAQTRGAHQRGPRASRCARLTSAEPRSPRGPRRSNGEGREAGGEAARGRARIGRRGSAPRGLKGPAYGGAPRQPAAPPPRRTGADRMINQTQGSPRFVLREPRRRLHRERRVAWRAHEHACGPLTISSFVREPRPTPAPIVRRQETRGIAGEAAERATRSRASAEVEGRQRSPAVGTALTRQMSHGTVGRLQK